MIVQRINFLILLSCLLLGCTDNNDAQEKRITSMLDNYAKLLEMNLVDSCITVTKDFLKVNINNDRAYTILGQAYHNQNDDSLAKDNFLKAININPNNFEALTGYAIVLDKARQYIAADDYYKKALYFLPSFYPALSNYAFNRLQIQDYKNAIFYGEKAVSIKQASPDIVVLCLSYYRSKLQIKGDSLFNLLRDRNYKYINELNDEVQKIKER